MPKALTATALAMVARLLRASARLTALVCVARFHDSGDVAAFAYGFVIASLTGVVFEAGLGEYVSREIAARTPGSDALVRRVVAWRLLGLPIACLCSAGLARMTGVASIHIAFGSALFALAAGFSDTLAALRRARSRHDLETLDSAMPVIAVAIGAISVLLGILSKDSFTLALGALATALVAVRAIPLLSLATRSGEERRFSFFVWEGRWFVARALVTTALFEGQTLLLGQLSSDIELAVYAIAVRPLGVMTQALSVLTLVFLPILSRTYAHDRARFDEDSRRLNLLHLVAIPAVFSACLLGGHVFLLAAGPAYAGGMNVLAVQGTGTLLYLATLTVGPLIAARRERDASVAVLVGFVVLIPLGAVLVPCYGALGAALASVGAFAATKLVHAVAYRAVGLRLGDRRHVMALVLVGGFLATVAWIPDSYRMLALLVGLIASAVITLYMLASIQLNPHEDTAP